MRHTSQLSKSLNTSIVVIILVTMTRESIFQKILDSSKQNPESKRQIEGMEIIPKDEWGHKKVLITGLKFKKVEELDKIISDELIMACLSDDMIKVYNKQYGAIVLPMFQLCKRNQDPDMEEMFLCLFSRVMIELRMSRSKDGAERGLQYSKPISERLKRGFGIIRNKQDEQAQDLRSQIESEQMPVYD